MELIPITKAPNDKELNEKRMNLTEAIREFGWIASWEMTKVRKGLITVAKFMQGLIDSNLLQEVSSPVIGGNVFYWYQDTWPAYLAIIKEITPTIIAESLWYETRTVQTHELWNIPIHYGDRCRFYLPLNVEQKLEIGKKMSQKCEDGERIDE